MTAAQNDIPKLSLSVLQLCNLLLGQLKDDAGQDCIQCVTTK